MTFSLSIILMQQSKARQVIFAEIDNRIKLMFQFVIKLNIFVIWKIMYIYFY